MKTVLIVDDEKSFLLSLEAGLRQYAQSFKTATAGNGKEALELLKRSKIDLVITDLNMPEMDGFQLLAVMTKTYPDIPVIIMTAYSTPAIKNRVEILGSFRVQEKPINFKELAENIVSSLSAMDTSYLKGITLPAFLQLVEIERKTCTLKVTSNGVNGFLCFRDGELLEAATKTERGENAAYSILSWENVEIEINSICKATSNHVGKTLNHILMEGFRLKDERKRAATEREEAIRSGRAPAPVPGPAPAAPVPGTLRTRASASVTPLSAPSASGAHSAQPSASVASARPQSATVVPIARPSPSPAFAAAQRASAVSIAAPTAADALYAAPSAPATAVVAASAPAAAPLAAPSVSDIPAPRPSSSLKSLAPPMPDPTSGDDDEANSQTKEDKMASIRTILNEFTKLQGVSAVCLVGRDGFLLDSIANSGIDTEMIGAIASSGYGASESMGKQLGKGAMTMSMSEFERGPVMFSPVGDDSVIVIIAEKDANLGMIRLKLKKEIHALASATSA